MRLLLVAIRDSKSKLFTPGLFSYPSTGVAIRSFTDAVNDEKSDYYRHPEDYSLFKMAEYDDSTGQIEVEKPEPLLLVKAETVLVVRGDSQQRALALEA